MLHTQSLRENFRFKRLYSKGKYSASSLLVIYYTKNGLEINRLGITVSAKVGSAVVRNRIRRRLRELYRALEPRLLTGCDIVIVARAKSAKATWSDLQSTTNYLFKKLGLITLG